MIQDQLRAFLQQYKKKTIELDTLQQQVPGNTEYQLFAEAILKLEAQGILTRIKSAKENNKVISLANKYSITHQELKQSYLKRLHQIQLELDKRISLEAYFNFNEAVFDKDLPDIMKIHHYLKNNGIPQEIMTFPKLSYELVQDEKWLQEKGGIALLKRIKLWSRLQTIIKFEPVVFAVNPLKIDSALQYHLIVENKTPFMELMCGLKNSPFTSIIYGAGWQIISGIQQFKQQIGTTCEDQFYYFGDLDHEGLHIWYRLNELITTTLATPFYEALIKKEPASGKANQKRHEASVEAFLMQFNSEDRERIVTILQKNGYYPQETLNKDELLTTLFNINVTKIQHVNEDTK